MIEGCTMTALYIALAIIPAVIAAADALFGGSTWY
jgi:hypothetical protein